MRIGLPLHLLPARLTVGLGIGARTVRAVASRRGKLEWASEIELETSDRLEDAIASLLDDAKLPRWPRPRVVAAVGPANAQAKRIRGLPSVNSGRRQSDMVAAGSSRFFLRNGVPIATTDVANLDAGDPWAGAFEQPVIAAIVNGCASVGLSVEGIVPAVAVLPRAMRSPRFTWIDGNSIVEIESREGRLSAVHRLQSMPTTVAGAELAPTVVEQLAIAGDDASVYADAFGASVYPLSDGFTFRPGGRRSNDATTSVRLVIAGAAALAAVVLALLAPTFRAIIEERSSRATLASLAELRGETALVLRELDDATRALNEISRVERRRTSWSALLSDLAGALPDQTAILTIRGDSASATLVLLAPRMAAALASMEAVQGLTGAELVGPITRESIAGRELERATVRMLPTTIRPGAPENAGDET